MADKKQTNEKERTYDGCYGERVGYAELDTFLEDVFEMNLEADKSGLGERFATCIWGHAGIGKTAKVKELCRRPVEWRKQSYPGYAVYDVPIAQFEEMGDLHGMPSRHVRMAKGEQQLWVPEEVSQGYFKDGWEAMPSAGVRTMYAPPDWVPSVPGPSVLLLDDWNRASVRIIKGIMQLLQNYGMVSWKLPEGCNIVLTGNPDEQDYLVTSIDSAILTRIRSVTLKEDAKEWSVWAQGAGLDSRGINFVLTYPEMMVGSERTNPRTLAQFFRDVRRVPDLRTEANQRRFKNMGHSLLDEQTVSSLMVFLERDVEMVLEPDRILEAKKEDWDFIEKHMERLMAGKEKRIDVIGVTVDRMFAYVVQPTTKPEKRRVENFQRFVTMDQIPEDIRHNLCLRLARVKDQGKTHQWILQNEKLTKMIMAVL